MDNGFDYLPAEMLDYIASRLDPRDLGRFGRVSSRFYDVSVRLYVERIKQYGIEDPEATAYEMYASLAMLDHELTQRYVQELPVKVDGDTTYEWIPYRLPADVVFDRITGGLGGDVTVELYQSWGRKWYQQGYSFVEFHTDDLLEYTLEELLGEKYEFDDVVDIVVETAAIPVEDPDENVP